MTTVSTARGPVATAGLGVTLVHEHLRLRRTSVPAEFPHFVDEDAERAGILAELDRAHAVGVRTICDPTVLGLGRDARLVEWIAARSPVNIVMATGMYVADELPLPLVAASADQLAERFVHDIEVGIQGTGIRAAFLKCVTDEAGLTPGVETVLRAVARAHHATGVPIMTHSCPANRSGLRQLAVFEAEGVDPARVQVGHSGDSDDLGYLTEIARSGAFLGMDRFGVDDVLTTSRRVEVIRELVDAGYADRLLLSQDAVCVNDRVAVPPDIAAQRHDWHLTHVVENVVPMLVARGVDQRAVDEMLTANVHTWLGGARGARS